MRVENNLEKAIQSFFGYTVDDSFQDFKDHVFDFKINYLYDEYIYCNKKGDIISVLIYGSDLLSLLEVNGSEAGIDLYSARKRFCEAFEIRDLLDLKEIFFKIDPDTRAYKDI